MSDTQAPAESIFAHLLQMVEGMARGFAHLADTVPQASGLAALVRTMKADAVKLREMVAPAPPPAPEPMPEPMPEPQPAGEIGAIGGEVPAPAPDDPADHSADDLNRQELEKLDQATLDEIEAKADQKAEEFAKSKG